MSPQNFHTTPGPDHVHPSPLSIQQPNRQTAQNAGSHAPRAPNRHQGHLLYATVRTLSHNCALRGPQTANASRTFTTLSPLRPSLTPLRRPALTSFAPSPTTSVTGGAADLVSQSAVSTHPALSGLQLRFGPRNTMNGHTRLVQKRRHGFLYRMRSRTGRKIILRRRLKGRKQLAQ
jgi:large subunit ribosomal protein L34